MDAILEQLVDEGKLTVPTSLETRDQLMAGVDETWPELFDLSTRVIERISKAPNSPTKKELRLIAAGIDMALIILQDISSEPPEGDWDPE